MYSFKISSHVSFPLEGLDMRPFLAKDSPSQVTTYDLLSVICHHGTAGSTTFNSIQFMLPTYYEFASAGFTICTHTTPLTFDLTSDQEKLPRNRKKE